MNSSSAQTPRPRLASRAPCSSSGARLTARWHRDGRRFNRCGNAQLPIVAFDADLVLVEQRGVEALAALLGAVVQQVAFDGLTDLVEVAARLSVLAVGRTKWTP